VWRRAVGSPTTGTAARLDEIGIAGGGTPPWRVVDKWMLLQFTLAPRLSVFGGKADMAP
jgi:hypothetical protein